MNKYWIGILTLALTVPAGALENAAASSPNGRTAYLRQPDRKGGYRYCTASLLSANCALVPLHCLSSQAEGEVNELEKLELWVPRTNQAGSNGEPVPTQIVGVTDFASAPLDYDGLAVIGLRSSPGGSWFQLPSSALPGPEALPSGPASPAPKNQIGVQGFGRKLSGGAFGIANSLWFAFQSLPVSGPDSSGLMLFTQYKAPPKAPSAMSRGELSAYYGSLTWAMPGDEGSPLAQGATLVGIVSSSQGPDAWIKAKELGKAETAAPYNGVIPIHPHVTKIRALMAKACKSK